MSLLTSLNSSSSTEQFFTDSFKKLIEEHLPYLINMNTKSITIKPYEMIKYKGDFQGILLTYSVPVISHYATMRINGMKSFSDYDGLSDTFILAPNDFINRLYSRSRVVILG